MPKALVLADDFTGALDSGVKFSAVGAQTALSLDPELDLHSVEAEILVLCLPTRHMSPEKAYRTLFPVAKRAAAAGIPCIMKKTDSALRGNIGAELQALLDGAAGTSLHFVPAFPAMDRVTVNGIHYISGVPVAESVFGRDPFEPVGESDVSSLLRSQCRAPVTLLSAPQAAFDPAGICVYNCSSDSEMNAITSALHRQGRLHLLAGCAGLAASLPPYLGLSRLTEPPPPAPSRRLCVICGSLNPISAKQLDYGQRIGYHRIRLPGDVLTAPEALWEAAAADLTDTVRTASRQNDRLIIDSLPDRSALPPNTASVQSAEETRITVANRIGSLLKALLDCGLDSRLLIIGGDTLLAFLEALHCRRITPICELQQGVVLSEIAYQGRTYEVVSKSGGFGDETLLEYL